MRKITIVLLAAALSLTATFTSAASEPTDTASHRLPHTLTAAGGSLVVNGVVTEVFKHAVHEMRPDRSSNNSFPSRHTSWAFTASTIVSNELYRHSPWWSIGAQTLSSAVGIQRVAARRHWGSDVVSGAAIGILSTELSYFISRKIWGMPSPWSVSPPCLFRSTFAVSSEALYWLNSVDGKELRTGFGASYNYRRPLSECWGISATLRGASMPVKTDGKYIDPLSAVSLTAGACGHIALPCERLAIVCNAEIGAVGWLGHRAVRNGKIGLGAMVGAGLEWHLTPSFGFRGQAAYNLATASGVYHAIALSVSSVVVF